MQHQCTPFALFRVKPDGSKEPVSDHPDFGSGWQAGQDAVHVNKADAFSLYENGRRVARFGHSRLQPRATSFEWSMLHV